MSQTPQHPLLGSQPERRHNPRIYNPLTISELSCAKPMEISIFCKKA